MYIDTHTHLFDEVFDTDRDEVIARALEAGVEKMVFPAIDSGSHGRLIKAVQAYNGCYAAMGLHPTSVNDNPEYKKELQIVRIYLESMPVRFVAVGEVGLDLYWSKNFLREQEEVLETQIEWAIEYGLPLIFHTRDAFPEMIARIRNYPGLSGVFHGFSGTIEEYGILKGMGNFKFGIGGVLTFKKSFLPEVVKEMDLADILLETDAPYLTPVPYRGKRNESSYIPFIAERIAQIKKIEVETVADATADNAEKLFGL